MIDITYLLLYSHYDIWGNRVFFGSAYLTNDPDVLKFLFK